MGGLRAVVTIKRPDGSVVYINDRATALEFLRDMGASCDMSEHSRSVADRVEPVSKALQVQHALSQILGRPFHSLGTALVAARALHRERNDATHRWDGFDGDEEHVAIPALPFDSGDGCSDANCSEHRLDVDHSPVHLAAAAAAAAEAVTAKPALVRFVSESEKVAREAFITSWLSGAGGASGAAASTVASNASDADAAVSTACSTAAGRGGAAQPSVGGTREASTSDAETAAASTTAGEGQSQAYSAIGDTVTLDMAEGKLNGIQASAGDKKRRARKKPQQTAVTAACCAVTPARRGDEAAAHTDADVRDVEHLEAREHVRPRTSLEAALEWQLYQRERYEKLCRELVRDRDDKDLLPRLDALLEKYDPQKLYYRILVKYGMERPLFT